MDAILWQYEIIARAAAQQGEEFAPPCQAVEPDKRKVPRRGCSSAKCLNLQSLSSLPLMTREIDHLPSITHYLRDTCQHTTHAPSNRKRGDRNTNTHGEGLATFIVS